MIEKPIAEEGEIERLRAEVETLRDGLDYLRQMQGAPDVLELRAKAARAERLAEALREARDYVATALREERYKFAGREDCSDIPGVEADLHKIDTALRDYDEACKETETLRTEVRNLKAHIEQLKADLRGFQEVANYQAFRAGELAEALQLYGQHRGYCDLATPRTDGDCPCGFRLVRERSKEKKNG